MTNYYERHSELVSESKEYKNENTQQLCVHNE